MQINTIDLNYNLLRREMTNTITGSKRKEWDMSYKRGENHILYPQAEVVRFLNRFVAKRKSFSEIVNIIGVDNRKIKCLDFSCGAGVHTILCHDFNIEAYGIDISKEAIQIAKKNAVFYKKKIW